MSRRKASSCDATDGRAVRQSLHPAAGLWTSLEFHDDRAIYKVNAVDELYQQRLGHMGFAPTGTNQFIRNLSATGDVRRTHANFARHLEEMLLQSARRRPVHWRDALGIFLARVEGTPLRWFLYGFGALAIRGIDVDPGDLDFCVDDAGLAGAIFDDLLIEPVTMMTDWMPIEVVAVAANRVSGALCAVLRAIGGGSWYLPESTREGDAEGFQPAADDSSGP